LVAVFDTPIITNDQSIERVLGTGLPVALVFLEGKPGVNLAEALERLARENAGKLLLAQVQVRDNPATVAKYYIQHPPAIVTIRNGQMVSKAESVSGIELDQHIAYLLGKGPMPQKSQPQTYRQEPSQPRTTQVAGPRTLTDANFDQTIAQASSPVLVDFWAPWCGPCRITEPIVERLSHEMNGKLVVGKVNVDENPGVSRRYGVQGIPTMIIFRNGQVADRWVGALPEPAIRNRIAAFVK
jgi:thioredoxin 1